MKSCVKLFCLVVFSALLISCEPEVTDGDGFALYYYNVEIAVGDNVTISPSYHGTSPDSFRIYTITRNGEIFYNPKLDGELLESDEFYVNPQDGAISIKSLGMTPGTYFLSLTCKSGGQTYDYPDLVTVYVLKK